MCIIYALCFIISLYITLLCLYYMIYHIRLYYVIFHVFLDNTLWIILCIELVNVYSNYISIYCVPLDHLNLYCIYVLYIIHINIYVYIYIYKGYQSCAISWSHKIPKLTYIAQFWGYLKYGLALATLVAWGSVVGLRGSSGEETAAMVKHYLSDLPWLSVDSMVSGFGSKLWYQWPTEMIMLSRKIIHFEGW